MDEKIKLHLTNYDVEINYLINIIPEDLPDYKYFMKFFSIESIIKIHRSIFFIKNDKIVAHYTDSLQCVYIDSENLNDSSTKNNCEIIEMFNKKNLIIEEATLQRKKKWDETIRQTELIWVNVN